MTKKHSIKRSLVASILVLCSCFASLIGTTFAWFTDSATSSGNVIKSGTLNVEMYYADGTKAVPVDDSKDWINANEVAIYKAQQLWEPGYTDAKHIKVSNEGTLALKYQLAIIPTGEVSKLAEVIDVYLYEIKDTDANATQVATRYDVDTTMYVGTLADVISKGIVRGNLEAGADYTTTVVLKMREEAGNEYQNLSIGNDFAIRLLATQYTSENDSFGNDYDEDAWMNGMIVYSEADMQAAISNGGTVILGADIVSENGFVVESTESASTYSLRSAPEATVIDMNGHTLTVTGERAYGITVKGNANVIIKNGKLVAESTNHVLNGTGTSTGASSSVYFESKGSLLMENVEIKASVRGGHRAVEIYNGSAVLNNVTINAAYGSGVNAGSNASVVLNDCDITVKGMYSAPYNSVCFSVMSGGSLTVNSGNYKLINDNTYTTGDTHGGWVGIVMDSGGTITTNGGTFENVPAEGFLPQYERAIIEAENLDPATATVNLFGGTFIPQSSKVISGYGDVNYPVVNACLIENGDGTWTAIREIEGVTLSTVAGYAHLYTDGTNYYVYDAEGLISMRNFWADNPYGNNMWGRSYNIMADIDATGYTWNNVFVVVGSNDNDGFVIDGHGNTITGLAINGGLFSGTPNGGNKPENPGYVQNITFDGVTVIGDHFTAVLWSNVYNELVVENVTVKNSTITGKCNVAALVGGTVIENSPDASVTFKNCVIENNAITAEGKDGQDPNGANVFISRVYGNTNVSFESCTSNNNTVINNNDLVGGGIYGFTVWTDDGFAGTGTCNDFSAWSGLVVTKEAEAVAEALKDGKTVVLTEDVKTEAATTAPYGNKYGVALNGGVLDGQGNELYTECYGDDYGIMTTGGTVKNLTITEGCRAVMIMYPTQDIVIDNVKIGGDGVLYPINTGEAGSEGIKLIVTNSTLAGWTSYSNIESAYFENVKFEQGTYYNNIYGRVFKPYVNTTMKDCSFIEHMNLDLSALIEGQKITMINCTVNGQTVTAETFTVPTTDAEYDTELFTVDLPAWADSVEDCIVFE